MKNSIDNKLIYVKVEQVAEAKGVTARAVRKGCENNKYVFRYSAEKTRCRGGKQYEILLSSVEPEIQEKILKKIDIQSTQVDDSSLGSKGLTKSSHNTPVLLDYPINEGVNDTAQKLDKNTLFSSSTNIVPFIANKISKDNVAVPEKAKKLALAKVDLINHWEAYRSGQSSKTEADQEFLNAYNSKVLCSNLYKLIGECSIKSLQRWRKELKDANNDFMALVPNYKYGNEREYNTCLSKEEQSLINDLMLRPNKLSVGNAYRIIGYALKQKGLEQTASLATYKRYIDNFKRNHNDVWTFMREGAKALNDKVAPFIVRDSSVLEVGDVLVADGNVLDFQVQNPFTGKPCRATMVCYQDFASRDIAGFDIMLNENTQCVASALRNSIIRLGKIPKIAYQDNGRSFKNKFFNGDTNLEECGFYGLFGRLGINAVFTKPYHGQSKPIERFFREFTQTCASMMPSYIGNNIENKPAYMMRNEIIHKAIHDGYIPTIQEATQCINAWLEFYRSQPCPVNKTRTIGEVFNEGRGEGVDIEQLDDLMMACQIRKVGRNGIKMFGNYYFDEELYGIKDSVSVRYSLSNIFEVKVYSLKGDYICKAEAIKEIHPFASLLGDANDLASFRHIATKQRNLEKATLRAAKELLPRVNKKLTDWENIKKIEKKVIVEDDPYKDKDILGYNNVSVIPKTEQKYQLFN
ncbi:MAG: transposase [Candidatus Gastranaerophilales bacterium]|nr:transposase [Candidatus Gastranaerophilales bacterium]